MKKRSYYKAKSGEYIKLGNENEQGIVYTKQESDYNQGV